MTRSLVLLLLLLGSPSALALQHVEAPGAPHDRALGGPESVTRNLEEQEELESMYRFDSFRHWGAPYLDWKKRLKDEHGVSFDLSAHLLYQQASETLSGEDDAFGGIYRFQGSWNAFGRGTGHPGRLEWRVENRSAIGGWMSPGTLGGDVGAAALNTGFGYSESFDTDLAVLSWSQGFNDQRAGIALGRLAFDVYQDAYLFQTFSRGFLNRAFLVNPTIGTTGIGALGGVAKGFVTDNVWVGGQVFDGNAVSGDFDLDTFQEHEWLKSVEIGWSPSIDRYKTDRVQFTFWEKDAREKAAVSEGRGWAISTSFQLTERVVPFARFGHSDGRAGVAAESAASVGCEFSPRLGQALSFGAGWADPSEATFGPGLDDEYVFETSYEFQLSPNVSVLPDLQLLLDPAGNPAEDRVWVFGLRAILTL